MRIRAETGCVESACGITFLCSVWEVEVRHVLSLGRHSGCMPRIMYNCYTMQKLRPVCACVQVFV